MWAVVTLTTWVHYHQTPLPMKRYYDDDNYANVDVQMDSEALEDQQQVPNTLPTPTFGNVQIVIRAPLLITAGTIVCAAAVAAAASTRALRFASIASAIVAE